MEEIEKLKKYVTELKDLDFREPWKVRSNIEKSAEIVHNMDFKNVSNLISQSSFDLTKKLTLGIIGNDKWKLNKTNTKQEIDNFMSAKKSIGDLIDNFVRHFEKPNE